MNNISLNFHTARSLRAERVCINGQWQLHIHIDLEDDGIANLAIFADTREALEFSVADDRYCRITGQESVVEHSDKPFPSACSADPAGAPK